MPEMEPTPIDPGPYKPAVSAFLRCHLLRARRTPSPRPARHRGADLLDILYPASNSPICPGCPMVPGVPDHAMRYPACEVCRWPAVGLGQVHAWHCRFCRHWNEHGSARPRSAAVVLQLSRGSRPARELVALAIPLVFGYPTPQNVEVWRDAAGNTQGAAVRGFVESRRLRRSERPLYVRGTVRRHPVLLVGGDGSDPYPLGLAEHWAELRSVGRWVTPAAGTRGPLPRGGRPPCMSGRRPAARHPPMPASTCWWDPTRCRGCRPMPSAARSSPSMRPSSCTWRPSTAPSPSTTRRPSPSPARAAPSTGCCCSYAPPSPPSRRPTPRARPATGAPTRTPTAPPTRTAPAPPARAPTPAATDLRRARPTPGPPVTEPPA